MLNKSYGLTVVKEFLYRRLMMKNQYSSLLFSLLREAIWRKGEISLKELSAEDAKNLLCLAEKQAILGLVIDALIRHDVHMPEQILFDALGVLEQIKRNNHCVNEGVIKLHYLMEEYNIHYAVIKGQVVASYYPDSLIRQSGDIDYYCSLSYYERSMLAVKEEWGILPEVHGSEKHADFNYQENRYEAHFHLTDLHSRRRNEYLQSLIDDDKRGIVKFGDAEIRTFSLSLHSFYIFLHIYYHLIELGVGLRQFCDWAIILHSRKDEIDHEAIKKHLKVLGMEKAYRACGAILVRDLGLPAEEFTYELTDNDKHYADKILDIVFYRGNMGHYNKRSGFHGWKHKIESTGIKLSHFLKFYPLAPSFMCAWAWDVFKSRVCQ